MSWEQDEHDAYWAEVARAEARANAGEADVEDYVERLEAKVDRLESLCCYAAMLLDKALGLNTTVTHEELEKLNGRMDALGLGERL